ncbi:MAG: LysR substrate-binding domain-containing protein [Burkholderiaceae bacterium]
MTLTELRYVVAVAKERHFGRAAESCFVSQPTLSVAIKKLEDELGVTLFERGGSEIGVTAIGTQIVEQARRVLEQSHAIKEIAKAGKDPLNEPLRLGVIYTIGPYLLPQLVRRLIADAPQMALILEENYTVRLIEQLKDSQIDAAILALPLPEAGLMIQPLYDEDFIVAVPRDHPWTTRERVTAADLKDETMLLLGAGHCFRDQVLAVCPELQPLPVASWAHDSGIRRTFEGSSLETIRHMVASGIGVTVLPRTSVPSPLPADSLLRYIPFEQPVPGRRVVLAWRKSFPRRAAIEVIRAAVRDCNLDGTTKLDVGPSMI